MQICTVIGHIWSTKKEPSLEGFKLMLVKEKDVANAPVVVAADLVGAGVGEEVLVVTGSTARVGAGNYGSRTEGAPIDAAIVGIIDTVETGRAQGGQAQ